MKHDKTTILQENGRKEIQEVYSTSVLTTGVGYSYMMEKQTFV